MLDEHGEISPFGWAVGVSGRPEEQVGHTMQALVDQAKAAWARSFPKERGYRVEVESRSDGAQGVHLTACRGDFRAEATVEHALPSDGACTALVTGASVRAFGRARSEGVAEALERGERVTRVARVLGGATGLSVFLTLAWLMIGVNNPIYMLGGMLLAVALITTLMAGALLGGWLGERIGASYRQRARLTAVGSPGFDDDVRRWKALSRQMLAQRSALSTRRGQPFRREPAARAS